MQAELVVPAASRQVISDGRKGDQELLLKAVTQLALTAAIAMLHRGRCTREDPVWGRCRPGRPVQRPIRTALPARCLPKARIMST